MKEKERKEKTEETISRSIQYFYMIIHSKNIASQVKKGQSPQPFLIPYI